MNTKELLLSFLIIMLNIFFTENNSLSAQDWIALSPDMATLLEGSTTYDHTRLVDEQSKLSGTITDGSSTPVMSTEYKPNNGLTALVEIDLFDEYNITTIGLYNGGGGMTGDNKLRILYSTDGTNFIEEFNHDLVGYGIWEIHNCNINARYIRLDWDQAYAGVFEFACYGSISSDIEAPTVPVGLAAANITESSVDISWNTSSDNIGVTGYDVYQDSVFLQSVTTTNLTVTGLSASTSYGFQVKAKDAAGNESALSTVLSVSTPDTQAPTVPGGLSASNVLTASFTLSWNSSSDNVGVTGYTVYLDDAPIDTLSQTIYNVIGLTPNTTYSMSVEAHDAAGNTSAQSSVLPVTTLDNPLGCSASGTILFEKWDGIAGRQITDLTNNANYPDNPTSVNELTSMEIPTNADDNYGVRLSGYICIPASGDYTFYIAADHKAELWLSFDGDSSNIVQVAYVQSWTDSQQWTKYAAQTSSVYTLSQNQLLYVDVLMKEETGNDNLAVGWTGPGISNITVIDGAYLSPRSGGQPDTEAPTVPTGLASANITETTVDLSWNASTDNIGVTGYDVYQDSVFLQSVIITNLTVTGLSASTSYGFQVKAKDASGNQSGLSSVLNVTTNNPLDTLTPTVPDGLSSTAITQTSFTLSWNASTDNIGVIGYTVYQDGVPIDTSNQTSYDVSGLTPNTTYSMSVEAYDATGNTSVQSSALLVTTLDSIVGCNATGTILFEKWEGIGGLLIDDLRNNVNYPDNPSSYDEINSMEIPVDAGDSYGVRLRGNICIPASGDYTFYIASDDNGELWLSFDGNPANLQLVASAPLWTGSEEWNKYPEQQSNVFSLNQGQSIYVEVLMKEALGGDNLAVGWTGPGITAITVIDGIYLSPPSDYMPDNTAPSIPDGFLASNVTETSVDLAWNASTDNDTVIGYNVYLDSTLIQSVTTTNLTVSGLTVGTTYNFKVNSKDRSGNESGFSNSISVTTRTGIHVPCITSKVDLNASMVTTIGAGDAGTLFDEQTIAGDPQNGTGGNPTTSWNPGAGNYPSTAYIDFGEEYYLDELFIYDVENNGDFAIDYGTPGNWINFLVDHTTGFHSWNQHTSEVTTRYLQFTSNAEAVVNEIVLYGCPTLDTIAPSAITSLSVKVESANYVTLEWSASGDDGIVGIALNYDLRMSTSPIDDTNFNYATAIAGIQSPSLSGTLESFSVQGLDTSTTYYFAMKVIDEVNNTSGISNVVSATTTSNDIICGCIDPYATNYNPSAKYSDNSCTYALVTSNDCDYIFEPGVYELDNAALNLPPGSVIGIRAGGRGKMSIRNFQGTEEQPFFFVNIDGQVNVNQSATDEVIKVRNCSYLRISGTGSPAHQYGIKISAGSHGLRAYEKTDNIEIDHLEVTGVTIALWSVTRPSCDGSSNRGTYVQENTTIHHNYIHDVDGEAMYIGGSKWDSYFSNDGCPGEQLLQPDVKGVWIFNNLCENMGWDGIQVGGCIEDCEIYNNTIINSGLENNVSHQSGIQINPGTVGKIYANRIIGGTGSGIQLLGFDNLVFSNLIDGCQKNAIHVGDRSPLPNMSHRIVNNSIINVGGNALNLNSTQSINNVFYNNFMANINDENIYTVTSNLDTSNNIITSSVNDYPFEDVPNRNLTPISGSALIDEGKTYTRDEIPVDLLLRKRIVGSGLDIGAFEKQETE